MAVKWKIEDIETFIKNQAESGLNQREFCEKHGIKYSTFQFWKARRLKKATASETGFIKLPPEVTRSDSSDSDDIHYQLNIGSNSIFIPAGFSIAEVKSLIALL